MKSIYSILLLSLSLLLVNCTSNQTNKNTDSEEETPTEAPASEPTDNTDEEPKNYEITVLKSDIPSPRKEMKGTAAGADVVINYGSPSVKDRQIWGGLEPYGEVWRTGANEATTIELKEDVMVEGKKLEAGRYGLFTIPNEDNWVIIFNSEPDQWGDYKYDEAKDVLRVTVTPKFVEEHQEALDFMIDGEDVVLRWDKVIVPFTISQG